ncbi:hypothetical protein TI39_contig345g00009 [Zymoseptoria brevis]|uniref:Uncharacterized protein n=1 Tax=Zymoseptoria brevis TaxID=1047168 RepID=A0A0F4GRE1_9PEZI|nr:hypothetical protein TI39_contig345g00009 [Zymoseptoria brevis]
MIHRLHVVVLPKSLISATLRMIHPPTPSPRPAKVIDLGDASDDSPTPSPRRTGRKAKTIDPGEVSDDGVLDTGMHDPQTDEAFSDPGDVSDEAFSDHGDGSNKAFSNADVGSDDEISESEGEGDPANFTKPPMNINNVGKTNRKRRRTAQASPHNGDDMEPTTAS